jgi:hypothetical protein
MIVCNRKEEQEVNMRDYSAEHIRDRELNARLTVKVDRKEWKKIPVGNRRFIMNDLATYARTLVRINSQ